MRCKPCLLAVSVAASLLTACRQTPPADPRLVSEWMRSFYGTLRVERLSPPVAARLMGYVTAALYSGLSANDPESATLESGLNGLPPLPTSQGSGDVDGMLTAIAAERVVVDSLLRDGLPTTRAAQAQLADSLAAARVALGISSDTKAKSEDLGRRIGLALVAWSRADGFDSTRALPAYVPPKGLAYWTNDSPVTTYVIDVSGQTPSIVATFRVEPRFLASRKRRRAAVLEGMGRVRNARSSPCSICPTSAPKRPARTAGAPTVHSVSSPASPGSCLPVSAFSGQRRMTQASAPNRDAPDHRRTLRRGPY